MSCIPKKFSLAPRSALRLEIRKRNEPTNNGANEKVRENSQLLPRGHNKMEEAFSLENIAKERKVIPDPIDDRKFQE